MTDAPSKTERVRWLIENSDHWSEIDLEGDRAAAEPKLKKVLSAMTAAGLYTKWSTPTKSGIWGLIKVARRELARRASHA